MGVELCACSIFWHRNERPCLTPLSRSRLNPHCWTWALVRLYFDICVTRSALPWLCWCRSSGVVLEPPLNTPNPFLHYPYFWPLFPGQGCAWLTPSCWTGALVRLDFDFCVTSYAVPWLCWCLSSGVVLEPPFNTPNPRLPYPCFSHSGSEWPLTSGQSHCGTFYPLSCMVALTLTLRGWGRIGVAWGPRQHVLLLEPSFSKVLYYRGYKRATVGQHKQIILQWPMGATVEQIILPGKSSHFIALRKISKATQLHNGPLYNRASVQQTFSYRGLWEPF
jgi:hypothetical protein